MEKVHVIDGLTLPKFITRERLKELESFTLYEDDVFVVTYPKCGTTWTQQILKLVRSSGQQDDTVLKLSVPWLEDSSVSLDCEYVIKPRGFKSHMPYDKFPFGNPQELPCKFIYVARNPKDCATSFYYHLRARSYPNLEKEEYFFKFMDGQFNGDYFDHVLGWWKHKDDKNVLMMKYEDMKKDLHHSIFQISQFVGAKLSEEVIANIAEQTEFSNMKNNPLANNSWKPHLKSETDFMRKGIVGDWRSFLTLEQSAKIDAICESRLTPAGLTFDC